MSPSSFLVNSIGQAAHLVNHLETSHSLKSSYQYPDSIIPFMAFTHNTCLPQYSLNSGKTSPQVFSKVIKTLLLIWTCRNSPIILSWNIIVLCLTVSANKSLDILMDDGGECGYLSEPNILPGLEVDLILLEF
jgi:hypothetical protein